MTVELNSSDTDGIRVLQICDKADGYSMSLGIEIGTLESFFSFEKRSLGGAKQTQDVLVAGGSSWVFDAALEFETADIHVSERGEVNEEGGWRALTVRALESSALMDSVLRFVIPKELVEKACIGNKIIPHERRNQYHQFPADNVTLSFKSGPVIKFRLDQANLPPGFSPMVYLRDEPDCWILHFRALALNPSKFVLKGCCRYYNRPFPHFLQRLTFAALPWLRRHLLFVRERVSQRIPIQVNGAANIDPSETLSFTVSWVLENA